MVELQRLGAIWWDLHKYVMGHRPRDVDTTGWTDSDFIKEIEMLERIIPEWLNEVGEDEPGPFWTRRNARKALLRAKREAREEKAEKMEMLGFIIRR